jgi:hypothetical protein
MGVKTHVVYRFRAASIAAMISDVRLTAEIAEDAENDFSFFLLS